MIAPAEAFKSFTKLHRLGRQNARDTFEARNNKPRSQGKLVGIRDSISLSELVRGKSEPGRDTPEAIAFLDDIHRPIWRLILGEADATRMYEQRQDDHQPGAYLRQVIRPVWIKAAYFQIE